MEIAFFYFAKILSESVLVNCAGINSNEPYVIHDFRTGLRICTNALTHLLALWDKAKDDLCLTQVLHTLLSYGADARAPALYEVTPHVKGAVISVKQGMMSAGSGQSLMAFQMSMLLNVPPPPNFITDLIMMGHARFLPSDPDGLFVQWAPEACHWRNTEWDIEFVIDFLCPMEIMRDICKFERLK